MLCKFLGAVCLLLILAGCSNEVEQAPTWVGPAPTVIPLLSIDTGLTANVQATNETALDSIASATVQTQAELVAATPTLAVTAQADALIAPETQLHEVYIFDDQLNKNWDLAQSFGMSYDLQSTAHWFEPLDSANELDSGATSIAITPEQDFGELYFTVRPDAAESYPRGQVIGVSFWLNGGGDFIDTEALAITIVGSNSNPFWSAADNPVQADGQGLYSETRLYHLELSRSIPPNTWVQVIVLFKKLLYDPEFEYLTGLYLKNDEGYRNTFYIDNIATIWQEDTVQ